MWFEINYNFVFLFWYKKFGRFFFWKCRRLEKHYCFQRLIELLRYMLCCYLALLLLVEGDLIRCFVCCILHFSVSFIVAITMVSFLCCLLIMINENSCVSNSSSLVKVSERFFISSPFHQFPVFILKDRKIIIIKEEGKKVLERIRNPPNDARKLRQNRN